MKALFSGLALVSAMTATGHPAPHAPAPGAHLKVTREHSFTVNLPPAAAFACWTACS